MEAEAVQSVGVGGRLDEGRGCGDHGDHQDQSGKCGPVGEQTGKKKKKKEKSSVVFQTVAPSWRSGLLELVSPGSVKHQHALRGGACRSFQVAIQYLSIFSALRV